MGGAGNVATIARAVSAALEARGIDSRAANPWYFPTPEDYGARLPPAGFPVGSIELIPRPTPLPGDIAGGITTFCETFPRQLQEAGHPPLLDAATEARRGDP